MALLAGAILPIWAATELVVQENARALTERERSLRVVRVTTDDGQPLAGVQFPSSLVAQLKAKLAALHPPAAAAPVPSFPAASAASAASQSSRTSPLQQPPSPRGQANGGSGSGAGAAVVEPCTPVDPKAVKLVATPKPTITSFFAKKAVEPPPPRSLCELPAPAASPTFDPASFDPAPLFASSAQGGSNDLKRSARAEEESSPDEIAKKPKTPAAAKPAAKPAASGAPVKERSSFFGPPKKARTAEANSSEGSASRVSEPTAHP